jgi:hypothetical protein
MNATAEFGPGLVAAVIHTPSGERLPLGADGLEKLLHEETPVHLALLPRRLPLAQRTQHLTAEVALPQPLFPFQALALDFAKALAARPKNRVLLVSDCQLFQNLDAPSLAPALPPGLAKLAGAIPGGDSLLHEAALEDLGARSGRTLSISFDHPFSVAAFLEGRPVYCSGGYSGVEHFPSLQASGCFDPGLWFLPPQAPAADADQSSPAPLPWLAHHLALQAGRAITALGGLDRLVASAGDQAQARRFFDLMAPRLHLQEHGQQPLQPSFHSFDLHGHLLALLAAAPRAPRRLP